MTRLPGAIAARLPRGRGVTNGAELRLVALMYAREQLRRGAIQVEDEVVARKLGLQVHRNGCFDGPNVNQVRRLREKLVEQGTLVVMDARAYPCPIYVMPGGTPQKPENPDAFEPAHTRRFRSLSDVFPPPGDVFDLYASDDELEEILSLARKVGGKVAYDALEEAGIDVACGEPDAPDVLEALNPVSNEDPVSIK